MLASLANTAGRLRLEEHSESLNTVEMQSVEEVLKAMHTLFDIFPDPNSKRVSSFILAMYLFGFL